MSAPALGIGTCACGASTCAGGCAPDPDANNVAPAAKFNHAAIRDRLEAALGRERALDGLGTRDPADPALALADAWAGAMHVLAFSAARLAEDADLAAGTDPASLLELTRLIGYARRPAISAATLLALTVDPNATSDPVVPAGTQIATVPRDKELPLTFETDADLQARKAWNTLPLARPTFVQPVSAVTTELLISGTDAHATLGDGILARMDANTLLFARFVDIVRTPDLVTSRSVLRITGGVAVTSTLGPAMGQVVVLGVRSAAFGALAPDYDLVKPGTSNAATVRLLTPPAAGPAGGPSPTFNPTALQNALAALSASDWPNLTMPSDGTVDLSSVVKEALPERAVVFAAPSLVRAGQITAATEAFRAAFALSAAVTKITPSGIVTGPGVANTFNDKVRGTAIHIETQRLSLLASPDPNETVPSAGAPNRLTIAGNVALPAGRRIALAGIDATAKTRQVVPATVLTATPDGTNTVIVLTGPLTVRFLAEGLVISANVVGATHGKTPTNPPELLGSSDARRPAPIFPLSAAPVAYLADTSPSGYTPAIEVRVGGRLYQQVERFLDLPDDRAWRLRQRRDGGFEVQFAGRLPTASNNVTAKYRVGGGATGNVDAGRVSMLMTPVLGVAKAENLTAAEGGTDAAGPDDIRDAGDSVAMLDRVVALADFERFARAFRGVGKALATQLPESLRRTVYLTIAGADGGPASAKLIQDLGNSLALVSIPGRRVKIVGFVESRTFATIAFRHDPALQRPDVEAALRAALLAAFSAPARAFGQSLYTSELLVAAQRVRGVVSATVAIAGGADPVAAQRPRFANGSLLLADLVSITPDTLTLMEMTA